MRNYQKIYLAAHRDITLALIVASFVILAGTAAFIAADRHYADECRQTQEYRPCR